MSAPFEPDDRLTADDLAVTVPLDQAGRITWEFVLGLDGFNAAIGILCFLFSSSAGNFPSPEITIKGEGEGGSGLVDRGFGVFRLLRRRVLRRFITTVASVRPITSEEAMAIVLIIGK